MLAALVHLVLLAPPEPVQTAHPGRSTWSERDQDVSLELRLEARERGVYVDMTAFNG